MINKFVSLVLVSALLCTLGGASALANNLTEPDAKPKVVAADAATGTGARTEAKSGEKLKADMLKLVGDTKSGNRKSSAPAQLKPARSNNLSKGQKIAIGAGVAAAVVVLILVFHTRRHFLDGLNSLGTP
jgi:hypothetical protein